MAITKKISVALGFVEAREAKAAAKEDGISLSAFITNAVRVALAERVRHAAAMKFLSTFKPSEIPTNEEMDEMIARWSSRPKRRAAKKSRAA